MKQYQDTLRFILDNGSWQENRTGIRSKMMPGITMRFDMNDGFPAVTTKTLAWKSAKGELCGFLRPVRSAADFRALGCRVWDQNANENKQWLDNPFRNGEDDLGGVYGVQWRQWPAYKLVSADTQDEWHACGLHMLAAGYELINDTGGIDVPWKGLYYKEVDQIGDCVRKLINTPEDRRILFHAWNPAELNSMALPPCHLLYQFIPNQTTKELSLCMTQRSADYFLGIPFNIAESALLLHVMAHLTGYTPRWLSLTTNDSHIYENTVEQSELQLTREPYELPDLCLGDLPSFETIKVEVGISMPELSAQDQHDFATQVVIDRLGSLDPNWFTLEGYKHHEPIKAQMAV